MSPAVLCVDDDRNLCQILSKALRGAGYEVHLSHDGEDALGQVRTRQPDLVLLDVLLPKRDGFGVLEAIRQEPGPICDTPVVLVTGCTRTRVYLERAERLRAAAFLTKPVPLDDLVEQVGKALPARVGRPQASASTGRYAEARSAPVCGRLDEVPFPALLHHLHGMRASGVLHLRHGRKHKRVGLRDGRPVAVRSNLVNECLGNLLVRTNRIGQAELTESLRRMRRGEGLQGEILVAMQLLSEEALAASLRLQADEKLFEIFEWEEGRFELALGARLERANSFAVERSPADVILAGVRGRFPLHRIDAYLTENAGAVAIPGESAFYRFQDIELQPEEQSLLANSDPLPLADLLAQPEAVRRSAYALLVTGLLEMSEPVAQPTSVSPKARTASLERPIRRATTGRDAAPPEPQEAGDADAAEAAVRAELAALVERFQGASGFEVLGLGETPTDEQVREAYAELAKRTHPDRFRNASDAVKRLAEDAFASVARAYETLADETRRAEYRLTRRQQVAEAEELEEGHRALRAELEFQKGEARLRGRDYAGALESFQWAVDLYPEEGEYHAYLGWALYLARGQTPEARREALRYLRKGAKLAPDREKPYLFLGRLYREAGRPDVAERAFTRAIQLQPDCVEALRELRLIEMRRQKGRGLIARIFRRSGQAEAKRWPRAARPG